MYGTVSSSTSASNSRDDLAPPPPTPSPFRYHVREGDTLASVALKTQTIATQYGYRRRWIPVRIEQHGRWMRFCLRPHSTTLLNWRAFRVALAQLSLPDTRALIFESHIHLHLRLGTPPPALPGFNRRCGTRSFAFGCDLVDIWRDSFSPVNLRLCHTSFLHYLGMARARSLVLAALLLLMVLRADAGQNLRKTTCPLCNMDVKANINATILGDQYIYACEMAGHIDSLQNDPAANLGSPEKADITTDEIYKDATDIKCPVCGKGYDQLTHAVPWISKGEQKIYTCSEEHAQLVFDNPTKYVAAQGSTDDFCYGAGSVMFNGFQLAIGGDASCLMLLFQPWVLSSSVKYAFGFLGVVLLAMSLEGFGELRELVLARLYRVHGVVSSQADYMSLATPHVSIASDGHTTSHESFVHKPGRVPNAPKFSIVRRLPLWCKLALAAMYMVHLSLGYWVMLVIMTYETLMFVAVILGVGLGFVVFKDTDADELSGSIDPCCST